MKSNSAFNGVSRYTTTGRRKTRDELASAIYAQFRYKCPHCGFNTYIPKSKEKKLCRNCGRFVYKEEKVEFRERLEEEIRRNARKNI